MHCFFVVVIVVVVVLVVVLVIDVCFCWGVFLGGGGEGLVFLTFCLQIYSLSVCPCMHHFSRSKILVLVLH